MSNTNLIGHDDLEMLLENRNNISMSIFMPTDCDDPKQCIVRLKNIIYGSTHAANRSVAICCITMKP